MLMRFPDQHLSICLTANASNIDVQTIAERISDVFLGSEMRPTDAEILRDSLRAPSKEASASLQGIWWNPVGGMCCTITVADTGTFFKSATGGVPRRIMQIGEGRFVTTPVRPVSSHIRLDPVSGRLLIDRPTDPALTFVKVPAAGALTTKQLREYAGNYLTPEIPGVWKVEAQGDSLLVFEPRHAAVKLEPLFLDAFLADDLPVVFVRDNKGRVSGLKPVNRGVHSLVWTRSQYMLKKHRPHT
jgi:hypothetical protein